MGMTEGAENPATAAQPDWLEPELATLTRDRFSGPEWIFERKFDGERCIAYRTGNGKGQLTYAGKVGTGFDEATLASLHHTLSGLERGQPAFGRGRLPKSGVHWVEPELVGQVGFSEWTTAGGLRHPRYEGLRRDKDPASVIRERPQ
jgi:ATP-dependent DNA ligase